MTSVLTKACPQKETCGYISNDVNERTCPDCGAGLIDAPSEPSLVDSNEEPQDLDLPGLPPEDIDTRPVAFTMVIPQANLSDGAKGPMEIELREGDIYKVASERSTDGDINLKLPDAKNPGLSSQPLMYTVQGGELRVTGGGTNGYKVTTVESHASGDDTVVRKGQTVVGGAKTAFRVK